MVQVNEKIAWSQIDEIVHREGEGRWETGTKPKTMVVLEEEVTKEALDKEMVLNERTNRRLERVAIKP